MAGFLLEIGCEEIPDWMIEGALASLHDSFQREAGPLGGTIELLDATPRRLALLATGLADELPDVQQVVAGPYLSAGPKAAEGFARKNNTTVDALAKETDAKGERYIYSSLKKGETARDLFTRAVPAFIADIPWPKAMRWSGKEGFRFIRPIRWLVALLDDAVLPVAVAGVQAGNTTRGHRILGSRQPVAVSIGSYERALRDNFVLIRSAERRARIESHLGAGVRTDEAHVRMLVNLTEWPTPIRGSFDAAYLSLPSEILTMVMRHHQRYFSVYNEDGTLAPAFVAVTNTDGDPDGLIQHGNERVLRARFNDARFFWDADQRKPLCERVNDLATVTFQAKLGSYKDKAERVTELAQELGRHLGADLATVRRAALLAKTDLTTDMVKEFTDLQGIVGGLYAKAQGESEAVATAIYDHYKPVSMEAPIPGTLEGQILSIADKLDTLRECFRIGLIPTGSKDPFALRRAAQGIVKILFEAKLPLNLMLWVSPQTEGFLRERIQFYLRDVLRYAYDETNAVLAVPFTTLADLAERAEAVKDVRPTSDFEPLAASFKRIKNILKQAQIETALPPDPKLITAGPEQELYDAFVHVRQEAAATASYREKLTAIASLRPQVDLFFDKILVNDPDPQVRQNRLALLHSLLTEFSTIADFSEIVTQGGV